MKTPIIILLITLTSTILYAQSEESMYFFHTDAQLKENRKSNLNILQQVLQFKDSKFYIGTMFGYGSGGAIIEIHAVSYGTVKKVKDILYCYDKRLDRTYKFKQLDFYTLEALNHTAVFVKGTKAYLQNYYQDDGIMGISYNSFYRVNDLVIHDYWKPEIRNGISVTRNSNEYIMYYHQDDVLKDSIKIPITDPDTYDKMDSFAARYRSRKDSDLEQIHSEQQSTQTSTVPYAQSQESMYFFYTDAQLKKIRELNRHNECQVLGFEDSKFYIGTMSGYNDGDMIDKNLVSFGTVKKVKDILYCYDKRLDRTYKFKQLDFYTLEALNHTAIFVKGTKVYLHDYYQTDGIKSFSYRSFYRVNDLVISDYWKTGIRNGISTTQNSDEYTMYYHQDNVLKDSIKLSRKNPDQYEKIDSFAVRYRLWKGPDLEEIYWEQQP